MESTHTSRAGRGAPPFVGGRFGSTTRMSNSKRMLHFVAVLPGSFLVFAMAWLFIAPTTLYYCWDDAPPFLISWAPPFIHPEFNSLDGNLRDYYRVPEWAVYTVWFTFISGVFVIPALLVWRRPKSGGTRAA